MRSILFTGFTGITLLMFAWLNATIGGNPIGFIASASGAFVLTSITLIKELKLRNQKENSAIAEMPHG